MEHPNSDPSSSSGRDHLTAVEPSSVKNGSNQHEDHAVNSKTEYLETTTTVAAASGVIAIAATTTEAETTTKTTTTTTKDRNNQHEPRPHPPEDLAPMEIVSANNTVDFDKHVNAFSEKPHSKTSNTSSKKVYNVAFAPPPPVKNLSQSEADPAKVDKNPYKHVNISQDTNQPATSERNVAKGWQHSAWGTCYTSRWRLSWCFGRSADQRHNSTPRSSSESDEGSFHVCARGSIKFGDTQTQWWRISGHWKPNTHGRIGGFEGHEIGI